MASATSVRCFVGVVVPHPRLAAIETLRAALADRAAGIRWVRVEDLHVTVSFLGEIGSEEVSRVARRVREAAAKSPPFALDFGGLTVFPHPRRATVLCVAIADPDGGLARLYEGVESGLAADGFLRDARPFRPHLTVGRWRTPPASSAVDALLAAAPPLAPETWVVDEVRVMKSELTPRGANYTILEAIPLGTGLHCDSPPPSTGAAS